MEVTVVGLGYVGLVNAIYLASLGVKVIAYDIDKNKISLLRQGVATLEEPHLQELLTESASNIRFTANHKDALSKASYIFICVDTPQDKDGGVNLSNFNNVLDTIASDALNDQTIVIRSTVPVGTNKIVKEYLESKSSNHFDVISFPEFLSNKIRSLYGCDAFSWFNSKAKTVLRTNLGKISRDELSEMLRNEGFENSFTSLSPAGIILEPTNMSLKE